MAGRPLRVVVESGTKRSFASAIDFPGWARPGRDEDAAIEALLQYAERYRRVAKRAGVTVPAATTVDVIERLPGDATTDFGAPSKAASAECVAHTPKERARQAALVQAAWDELADVVASSPETLRKGPRGGGRDTSKIDEHVLGAEQAYKGKLGIRRVMDPSEVRELMLEAIRDGRPPEKDNQWPSAYAARRIAWHALDHAWEIEDRRD